MCKLFSTTTRKHKNDYFLKRTVHRAVMMQLLPKVLMQDKYSCGAYRQIHFFIIEFKKSPLVANGKKHGFRNVYGVVIKLKIHLGGAFKYPIVTSLISFHLRFKPPSGLLIDAYSDCSQFDCISSKFCVLKAE